MGRKKLKKKRGDRGSPNLPRLPEISSGRTDYRVPKERQVSDAEGLKRAYSYGRGLYQKGNNLYIAGTKDARDVLDDLKLPFDGGAKNAQRYQGFKNI